VIRCSMRRTPTLRHTSLISAAGKPMCSNKSLGRRISQGLSRTASIKSNAGTNEGVSDINLFAIDVAERLWNHFASTSYTLRYGSSDPAGDNSTLCPTDVQWCSNSDGTDSPPRRNSMAPLPGVLHTSQMVIKLRGGLLRSITHISWRLRVQGPICSDHTMSRFD